MRGRHLCERGKPKRHQSGQNESDTEAAKTREGLLGIFNRMREGDCSQLYDLQNQIQLQMAANEAFVKETEAEAARLLKRAEEGCKRVLRQLEERE